MIRKHPTLLSSTALTAAALTAALALALPAHAQSRSDGDGMSSLENPNFDATTSMGVVTGDNLGSHLAATDLDMAGFAILNLGNPIDPDDAVNLSYLQTYVAANGDHLGNHIATQNLNMGSYVIWQLGAPTGPTHAANKAYVDTAATNAMDNLGDHIATRNLMMQGNMIRNLADPVSQTDAVNVRYLSTYVTANGDHLGNHEATTALNMRGNPINNVTNPTNPTDAVNLQTMDSAIKTVTDSVSDLEAVSVTGGAGLLGGGDLTQDRVIDFDITWGDGRYAMRSRQLLAGTGLTGGGNLHADRTISLDVTYADNRFVNNAGNEAISGSKSFTSPVVVPAPTANSHATNKNYVDNAMASAPGTIYSAGDGLTLSAGNQFAVNSSVIRTTGDQNLNGVKNFVGTLQHFHNSNVADGSMKFGRNANQYIQLHGGSNANFLTSVSPESDDRPLRIRLQNGAIEHEYQFFSNGIIRGVADPANPIDAANKAYVDQAEADAVAAAGAQVINTGLGLVGGGSIDSGLTIAVQSDMWRRNASDPNHGLLAYNGHSPTSGQFYGGSSNPNYTNRLNYGGSFYATNFYSTNYYYFSDENLKDDIETISADSGMDTVRKLRPVSYTWKEGGAEALGLIAQEVEDVAPSAVTTNEAGTMAVDYIQLMAPMLAAIQELDARVTALEAKID